MAVTEMPAHLGDGRANTCWWLAGAGARLLSAGPQGGLVQPVFCGARGRRLRSTASDESRTCLDRITGEMLPCCVF